MVLQSLALPFLFYAMNVTFITRAGGYTKAPILITNIPYLLIKAPLVVMFAFIYPGVSKQALAYNRCSPSLVYRRFGDFLSL
jgi:Na+-driven multidrug efflux pump